MFEAIFVVTISLMNSRIICLGEENFGCFLRLGLTNHKHMLISQDMLMTHPKNYGTY